MIDTRDTLIATSPIYFGLKIAEIIVKPQFELVMMSAALGELLRLAINRFALLCLHIKDFSTRVSSLAQEVPTNVCYCLLIDTLIVL